MKDIYFFMDEEDLKQFINFIYAQGDMLIYKEVDEKGDYQPLKKDDELSEYKYLIYNPEFKIVLYKTFSKRTINESSAEVIEFIPCGYEADHIIRSGRLFVEMTYFNENRERIIKNDNLDKKYKKYKKYIAKYYKISKNKRYYIGPSAYKKYEMGYIMREHIGKHLVEF